MWSYHSSQSRLSSETLGKGAGAIYFAIFITIGAFIGVNLLVVVVTINLEQMMKSGEQRQLHQITFSETGDCEEELGSNPLPLVHCALTRLETSGLPQKPLAWGPLSNLSEKTCDHFCLVFEAIQENLMQIVREVRSVRFNQEQEEELMNRHVSLSLLVASGPSIDTREMTSQQDLITALVNREKVQLASPTQSVLSLPPPPAQPSLTSDSLVKISVCSKICSGPLDCQAPQQPCQSSWFHPFRLQEAPPPPVRLRPLSRSISIALPPTIS
ncbi:hypothetical protein MC885_016550 [Smutsia gigantea]|nr:hypothetical protein MC885_016550 [Smutsia gigantea]